MSSPSYDISNRPLGSIATFGSPGGTKNSDFSKTGEGALARQLKPNQSGSYKDGNFNTTGQINVVGNYDWTLSKVVDPKTIPYIRLVEFYTNEAMVKKALGAFGTQISDTFNSATGGYQQKQRTLQVYDEIFDKSDPTDFSYWMPYFNKTSFELNTPNWQAIDGVGDSLKKLSGSLGSDVQSFVGATVDFATAASNAALAWQYAGVGIFDRPRLFAGHSERQINISFPLFNTKDPNAWSKNRDLIYLLMSQNQYNKRDYITGLPPVFYEVYIPGQYFCYAAAMTNIQVENLGNVRMMQDSIVPDAYQINLTLSEMTMPSKNQFEAITSGEASKFVNSQLVLPSGENTANVNAEIQQNINNQSAPTNP